MNTNYSLLILFLLILNSANLSASSSCQSECGGIAIPYPFGIGNGCYLNKFYEIECLKPTASGKHVPFLPKISKEVVSISLIHQTTNDRTPLFGSVRVRSPISSAGCSSNGKDSTAIINLTGSPFFIETNTLVAVGCNSKVLLTHTKPSMVGCELKCSASKDSISNSIHSLGKTGCSSNVLSYISNQDCTESKPDERGCEGYGCCQVGLAPDEPQQVIGIRIESNDLNSTTRKDCRVAFLTDDYYTTSNVTTPEQLFAKGNAAFSLGWVIQTTNISFLNSLACKSRKEFYNSSHSVQRKTKCVCDRSTVPAEISYANCGCNYGYTGNPYTLDGCKGQHINFTIYTSICFFVII